IEQNKGMPITQSMKMFTVLSRPEIGINDLLPIERVQGFANDYGLTEEELEKSEIQIKYRGYIKKEEENANKLKRLENLKIPENFDYSQLRSLSTEAKQKLEKTRPDTIAQASRISGVSPSDISILLIYMGR